MLQMVMNRASKTIRCPWCNSKIFRRAFVKHLMLAHQIEESEAIRLFKSRLQEQFVKGEHHLSAVIPMAPGKYSEAVYAFRTSPAGELPFDGPNIPSFEDYEKLSKKALYEKQYGVTPDA